ncbi:MAG: hypothetical protein L6Q99_12425 [Planctomycetes bacterium]|nr:hypothetical protein [Planctomycetota bacterium]
MNRRKRAEKKKKERAERLRRERHERQSRPAEAEEQYEEVFVAPELDDERYAAAARRALGPGVAPDSPEFAAELARQRERPIEDVIDEALDAGGREAGEELGFHTLECDPDDQLDVAREALALDPDNVDALACVALTGMDDASKAADELARIVERAGRALGPDLAAVEPRGDLGANFAARPYLRARAELTRLLASLERPAEALQHAREIAALDRGDSQVLCDVYVGLLLEFDELAEARALFERFAPEESPALAWASVLERFLSDDRVAARRTLALARALLPEFEEFLAGEAFEPEEDDDLRATVVAVGSAWMKHEAALEWLLAGAPWTSETEREAARATYSPPVAKLLELGEPDTDERADAARLRELGFGPRDVPELTRMACDVALHEHEADHPACWAPSHALRALTALRADAAVEPLLAYAAEHEIDEALRFDEFFAAIGPAAIERLARKAADGSEPVEPRLHAIEGLARIGAADSDARRAVVEALAPILREHERHVPPVNAFVIVALGNLGAREFRELARAAFRAGHVDTNVFADVGEIERRFRDGARR